MDNGPDKPRAPSRSTTSAVKARSPAEETVVPVLQEELDVHKRRVETNAGVRVNKTVEEHEQTVDVSVTRENVEVERVAVNRAVDAPVAIRHEGDTTIIPILEEVLVVEKRLMLKEEIRITRRKQQVSEPQRVTLRTEHAAVERIEHPVAPALSHEPREASAHAQRLEGETDLLEQKRRREEELRRGLSRPPSLE
jgi:uncharacterized protein (TIGR02271 family)